MLILKKKAQVNRASDFAACFRRGFTLVEMLITLAIIGVLIAMVFPNLQRIYEASWNAKCLGNLRQIGMAALLCTQDNGNEIPTGMPNTADPGYGALFLEKLSPYGLTKETLKCPADVNSIYNQYSRLGSSYQWLHYFDGDKLGNLKLLIEGGSLVDTPNSQARLVIDWNGVHYSTQASSDSAEGPGRRNAVYADGHVAVSGG